MNTLTVFAGLDYHSIGVQVCVMASDGGILANRLLRNDRAEIDDFVRRFGTRIVAAIEACTGAAHLADELAGRCGWDIRQAHPGFVSRMKQSPDKTDWGDARILADLTRVGYLPVVWLAPEPIRELRRLTRFRQQLVGHRLTRFRQQLVGHRRAIKLRIRAVLRECRVRLGESAWTKAWFAALDEVVLPTVARWVIDRHRAHLKFYVAEIALVEKVLAARVADDPIVAKLLKQTGIGLVTAAVMRAEIGQFDRFRKGKQLSRYCGLTPRNASSGQRQADAGLVKAGNVQLRTTLIEAAHRRARFDPRWKAYAQQLRSNGKSGSVVAAAVANRWVRGLPHGMRAA